MLPMCLFSTRPHRACRNLHESFDKVRHAVVVSIMVRFNINAEPLHTAAFVGIVGIAKIGGG